MDPRKAKILSKILTFQEYLIYIDNIKKINM